MDTNVTIQESQDARGMAFVRLIVSLLSSVNLVLALVGFNPLPVDDATLYALLSGIAAVITDVWAWWKNNNVTQAAQEAQKAYQALKQGDDIEVLPADIKIGGSC